MVSDNSQPGIDPDPDGDGDPTNNDAPTAVLFALNVVTIPTLSPWNLLLPGGVARARLEGRNKARIAA